MILPVTGILMILTLFYGIHDIRHDLSLSTYPAHPDGISTDRRDGSVLQCRGGNGWASCGSTSLVRLDWVRDEQTEPTLIDRLRWRGDRNNGLRLGLQSRCHHRGLRPSETVPVRRICARWTISAQPRSATTS